MGCSEAATHQRARSTLIRHRRPRTRRRQAAGQTKATYPNVIPRRIEHIGRRPSGRLLRRARPETVRAHHFGSPSCKSSAGSPSGLRIALLSITSATAQSRPCAPSAAAARSQFHGPHRSQHECRAALLHHGQVRRLPRVRHPGPCAGAGATARPFMSTQRGPQPSHGRRGGRSKLLRLPDSRARR